MHAKVFSIQIFQYFSQIVLRVCTLVLFIQQSNVSESLFSELMMYCAYSVSPQVYFLSDYTKFVNKYACNPMVGKIISQFKGLSIRSLFLELMIYCTYSVKPQMYEVRQPKL